MQWYGMTPPSSRPLCLCTCAKLSAPYGSPAVATYRSSRREGQRRLGVDSSKIGLKRVWDGPDNALHVDLCANSFPNSLVPLNTTLEVTQTEGNVEGKGSEVKLRDRIRTPNKAEAVAIPLW